MAASHLAPRMALALGCLAAGWAMSCGDARAMYKQTCCGLDRTARANTSFGPWSRKTLLKVIRDNLADVVAAEPCNPTLVPERVVMSMNMTVDAARGFPLGFGYLLGDSWDWQLEGGGNMSFPVPNGMPVDILTPGSWDSAIKPVGGSDKWHQNFDMLGTLSDGEPVRIQGSGDNSQRLTATTATVIPTFWTESVEFEWLNEFSGFIQIEFKSFPDLTFTGYNFADGESRDDCLPMASRLNSIQVL